MSRQAPSSTYGPGVMPPAYTEPLVNAGKTPSSSDDSLAFQIDLSRTLKPSCLSTLNSASGFLQHCYAIHVQLLCTLWQAYSEVSNLERSQLMQQEVKGMRHLLALGARSDFHRDMLKDRSLTHPDLLQHCADGVRLPLQPPPVALSANDKLRRSLSRKLSSGGGSMRLLMKSTSMKAKDADLQSVEEDMQLTQDLIAVAYPENNG